MATGVMEAIYKLQYFIFLSMIKHRERSKEHSENTGNFVLLGAWQP